MKRLVLLAGVIAALLPSSAHAATAAYSARVGGLPEVQSIGHSYFVRIEVRNSGRWVKNFCLDFEDSGNSWLIKMPGLRAYDDDTFCYGTLKGGKKQFIARLIPAKSGAKELSITIGSATIYRAANNAVISDDNALSWSETFVLV